jgi:hypothetical protein
MLTSLSKAVVADRVIGTFPLPSFLERVNKARLLLLMVIFPVFEDGPATFAEIGWNS